MDGRTDDPLYLRIEGFDGLGVEREGGEGYRDSSFWAMRAESIIYSSAGLLLDMGVGLVLELVLLGLEFGTVRVAGGRMVGTV